MQFVLLNKMHFQNEIVTPPDATYTLVYVY